MTSRMNTNQGVAFVHDYDENEERKRYAQLKESLRPANLKIPPKSPPQKIIRTFLIVKSLPRRQDSEDSQVDGIAFTDLSQKNQDERTPSTDSLEDNIALLLCVTSLQFPATNVIPEDRIRTLRTPRTPATCRRRRTRSPSDECRNGRYCDAVSPSEVLIHRYKAMTPKCADFTM